jgi:hypothetical protein
MCIRVKIVLYETIYNSKDPYSGNLFRGTWYDKSLSWNHQLGNKVIIVHTSGYGCMRVSIGKAFITS